MRIYFYHTRESKQSLEEWKQLRFPGHLLYGLPLLEKYGIDAILHRHRYIENRWKLMLYVTYEIFSCRKKYDVLYGTSFRGLEIIIFLHALGLYKRPIVVWHHTALRRSRNKIREFLSCVFYKGIDHMFFFSQKHIDESIQLNKVPSEKLELVHWGPDLAFYDNIMSAASKENHMGFISTGKENRDVDTLIKAFIETKASLEIYISKTCGAINYKEKLDKYSPCDRIKIHYTNGVIPYILAQIVATKQFVVIPCLEYSYTVGLTTLVEALALGIPVICSKNPYYEMEIDKEQIGITVAYGDVQGWKNAIDFLMENPVIAKKMGENARRLAEKSFNFEVFSKEVAISLLNSNK